MLNLFMTRACIAASAALCLGACVSAAGTDVAPARPIHASVQLLAGADDGRGAADGDGAAARFADVELSATRNRPGLAIDGRGNVYLADLGNQVIRRISAEGKVYTVAGAFRQRGAIDAIGTQARFNDPAGLVADSAGNLYVADSANHLIRRIDAQGRVTTVAGLAGVKGATDGRGAEARFAHPQGLALDPSGNLLIADLENHRVRRMTPGGVVTTLAGRLGPAGDDDGPRVRARLNYPMGIAVDRQGIIYLTQRYAPGVRRISPSGEVSTLRLHLAQPTWGEATGRDVDLAGANALVVDERGNLLVADTTRHRLRAVSQDGAVSNLAGQFERGRAEGLQDGPAHAARFYEPSAIAIAPSGDLLVFDAGNATLRRIEAGSGMVSTVAGRARNRRYGIDSTDGRGTQATFTLQSLTAYAGAAMAADSQGTFYVAEPHSKILRAVRADGTVRTLAGRVGEGGAVDGRGNAARFQLPVALAEWGGALYVCDSNNSAIRKVSIEDGTVSTFAGALGAAGHADGTRQDSRLRAPAGIAVNAAGEMFVADARSHTLRKIDGNGRVSTLAGLPDMSGDADGTGGQARFDEPGFVALDQEGNLYVVDGRQSNRIRRVTPEGRVTTPSSAWAVPRTLAQVVFRQLAVLPSGDLIVVEANSHTVWRVGRNGTVDVFAGDPQWPGQPPGDLPGRLDHPSGLAVDAGGGRLGLTSGNAVFVIDLKK